jgi:hypothetical protein
MNTSRALLASVILMLAGGSATRAQNINLGERPPLPVAADILPETASPEAARSARQTESSDFQSFWAVRDYAVRAAATTGLLFDDNIYARSAGKIGDRVVTIRPEIGIVAKGDRFSTAAQFAVENQNYQTYGTEDQTNWSGSIGTTVQPRDDIQVQWRLGLLRGHEQRGAADSSFVQFDRPVTYDQYNAALAVNKRFDRWWTSVGGAGSWIHYYDPTIGGVPVDQSYRSGTVSVATGRVGYVVAPLTSVFGEFSYNWRQFGVGSFDSAGFRLVGGMLWEPGQGARIRGELFAGYMQQDYVGATFADFRTFTYGGALAFRIDPQATATFDGRREAKESILNGGVSVIESVASARIDYQLAPQIVIGAGVGYLDQYFALADRTDHTVGPLASLKYVFTPNITFGIDYRYIGFDSIAAGVPSYSRNAVLFALNGRI